MSVGDKRKTVGREWEVRRSKKGKQKGFREMGEKRERRKGKRR